MAWWALTSNTDDPRRYLGIKIQQNHKVFPLFKKPSWGHHLYWNDGNRFFLCLLLHDWWILPRAIPRRMAQDINTHPCFLVLELILFCPWKKTHDRQRKAKTPIKIQNPRMHHWPPSRDIPIRRCLLWGRKRVQYMQDPKAGPLQALQRVRLLLRLLRPPLHLDQCLCDKVKSESIYGLCRLPCDTYILWCLPLFHGTFGRG